MTRQQRHAKRLKDAGQCVKCGGPRTETALVCPSCRVKNRDAVARYDAKRKAA